MPEIKHTFTAGKMNKDLDERLVPNGQYREALNVQVRTTDSDSDGEGNAGVIQNIEGNVALERVAYATKGYDGNTTKMIASVADEKNDVAYFFAAAPLPSNTTISLKNLSPSTIINAGDASEVFWVDSIMEIKTVPDNSIPIFVDFFAVTGTWQDAGSPTTSINYTQFTVDNGANYRIGMTVYAQLLDGTHLIFDANGVAGSEIINIDGNVITLENQQSTALSSSCRTMKFIHKERVLEFNYTKLITGVNVLDNLLMFTDGESEPKKINITRAKAGTNIDGVINDGKTHTKLFVTNPLTRDIVEVTDLENVTTSDIKKENITVIKKKPTTPPFLEMAVSGRETLVSFGIEYYNFIDPDSVPITPVVGTVRSIPIGAYSVQIEDATETVNGFPEIGTSEGQIDLQLNDILIFTDNTFVGNPAVLRAKLINITNNSVEVEILFVDDDLLDINTSWTVTLEQSAPLFETKFGRFAYRYKYDDNEYSAFSPWSELAFLPGTFTYSPSQGFNKGMINNLRVLRITGFIPDDLIRPNDVETVEILWKTTDNANVYVVKSITREIDTEWELYTDNNTNNTGFIEITSEIIERVIEENQILRGWDNVPRYAVAQEVTANRLVYGNYTQGYNIDAPVGLKQTLISDDVEFPAPIKSVKASRSYKFGVVYGDEHGRETPVISSGVPTGQDNDNAVTTGDISVGKKFAHKSNKFKVEQNWEQINQEPHEWMSYAKYYVKETSSEYYNLVMDRWYEAKDGNVWLSFNSADRNKVDEETYLILKNENGSQLPVEEEARYKILAIASEAPDYIKLDYRLMDTMSLTYNGVYTGNEGDVSNANPIKLYNDNVLETGEADFFDVNVTMQDFKGIPKARITAKYFGVAPANINNNTIPIAEYKSPWKTISRILRGGQTVEDGTFSTSRLGIVLKSKYKREEVDAYLYFTESLGGVVAQNILNNTNQVDDPDSEHHIRYEVELADYVVENKAQFDGRFFVKIEKDPIVETRVLTGVYNEYALSGAVRICYITNRLNNPANDNASNTGNFSASSWSSYATDPNVGDTFPASDPTTIGNIGNVSGVAGGYGFPFGSNNQTIQFISWWKNNDLRESNIFLDGLQAAREITGGDSWEDNQIAGGDGHGPTGGNTFDWRYNFGNGPAGGDDYDNNLICLLSEAVYGVEFQGYDGGDAQYWGSEQTVFFPPQARFNSNSGLISGDGAQNGEFNYLILSVINKDGEDRAEFAAGQESLFKSRMQTEGQYFRFRGDPGQNLYRVIPTIFTYQDAWGTGAGINTQYNINTAEVTIQSHNLTGNNEHIYKHRESIVVKFQRVDLQSGAGIPGTGVDTNQWDPRGDVPHNGLGSFVIETLNRIEDEDSEDITITTDRACWETEPKSEEGLDVYYEASAAIPMRLDSLENNSLFCLPSVSPRRSTRVQLDKRIVNSIINSSTEQGILFGAPYVGKVYTNSTIEIRHLYDGSDQLLRAIAAFDTTNIYRGIGLGINDIVALKRKDGLTVFNKIKDHMQILSPGVATLSERFLNVDNVSLLYFAPFNRQYMWVQNATNFGAFTSASTATQASLVFNSRWQVTGGSGNNILPDGVFVVGAGEFMANTPYTLLTLNRQISPTNVQIDGVNNVNFISTTGYYKLDEEAYKYPVKLSWFNCYSFGNGVESDRIRDDFNAPQIDNGCRVSSTFLEYGEETISSGLIHSGLYNSISSVNNLNEFNMADKITKNLNPAYGSIQALKTLDNNLVSFTEDKVLKVLSNKDAVFNADGNPQLVATNRVLGDATPFAGDYGISKNPESLAVDNYRMYFTDKQRGAVLRLSMDGLTPISNVGMKSYFREKLKICNTIIGSFDIVNGEYNTTLNIFPSYQSTTEQPITVSFNEAGKGWVSFKSFVPDTAVSVSGKYLTAKQNKVYEHYRDFDLNGNIVPRNNFYGTQYNSELEMIFNDTPSSIKSFKTINYEGTQSRIIQNYADGMDYNLFNKNGWYVDSFVTDLQEGKVPEFIEKEGKWFNYIKGISTDLSNIDASEFSVQGIGFPNDTNTPFGGYGDVTGEIKDKGDTP